MQSFAIKQAAFLTSVGRGTPYPPAARCEIAVARLEREQRLENRGGSRVRRRDDGRDHAQRLGNAPDAERLVLLDHAAGLRLLVGVVDVFGGVVVFDHLVLHDAHARLLDGQLGQRDARLVGRHRRRAEDAVYLLLRIRGIGALRRAHALDGDGQRLHAVHDGGSFHCLFHVVPPILPFGRYR